MNIHVGLADGTRVDTAFRGTEKVRRRGRVDQIEDGMVRPSARDLPRRRDAIGWPCESKVRDVTQGFRRIGKVKDVLAIARQTIDFVLCQNRTVLHQSDTLARLRFERFARLLSQLQFFLFIVIITVMVAFRLTLLRLESDFFQFPHFSFDVDGFTFGIRPWTVHASFGDTVRRRGEPTCFAGRVHVGTKSALECKFIAWIRVHTD